MILTGLLWGCLLQIDPLSPFDAVAMAADASAHAQEVRQQNTVAQERRDFEDKFNKLINALLSFSREYNGSRGSVWPKKKAEAINKALQDLEQTRSWRQNRTDKSAVLENPDQAPGNTAKRTATVPQP